MSRFLNTSALTFEAADVATTVAEAPAKKAAKKASAKKASAKKASAKKVAKKATKKVAKKAPAKKTAKKAAKKAAGDKDHAFKATGEGYKGHRPGSIKEKLHQIFDKHGPEKGRPIALKIKDVAVSTVNTSFSQFRTAKKR